MRVGLAFAGLALLLAFLAGCGSSPSERAAKRVAAEARGQVDISNTRGTQSEVAIAVDPTNPKILLAGSNSFAEPTMRVYSSTDGGSTWSSTAAPPLAEGSKGAPGDPAVGIDRHGRQYYAWVQGYFGPGTGPRIHLYASTRAGPHAPWKTGADPVAPLSGGLLDDKETLIVDNSASSPHEGRVYIAWTRPFSEINWAIMLVHSDDGGRTWSAPVRANDKGGFNTSYASVATARNGDVYVAWDDNSAGEILIDRSTDGGAHFGADQRVGPTTAPNTLGCDPFGVRIPAQPRSCVRANPSVRIDNSGGPHAGRVYVTYGDAGGTGTEDVYLVAFDPYPHAALGGQRALHVNPPDGKIPSDQFWPAPAVDQSTGRLWVCFYDTTGDPGRKESWFSCTASSDGGKTWPKPVHAADTASNETKAGAQSEKFGREYGDYEGLAVAGGVAHPAWTDSRRVNRTPLQEEVYTTVLTDGDVRAP